MLRKLLPLLLLMGCSHVVTDTVVQSDAPVAVQSAQPMILSPVQWKVMGIDELKALLAQMQKSPQKTIVFVLDQDNYTNLSLNLVEIERYIKEQHTILDMLRSILAERAKSDISGKR